MNRSEAGRLGGIAAKKTQQVLMQQRRELYTLSPKHCVHCGVEIPYEKRRTHNFCNHSCSAAHGNVGVDRHAKRHIRNHLCPCGLRVSRNNKYCDSCIAIGLDRRKAQTLEECHTDQARKRYLMRVNPHQCQICVETTWLGQPIPLEMDHIDGNPDNNSDVNLRLICPNCHALTPTWKNRPKGKQDSRNLARRTRESPHLHI